MLKKILVSVLLANSFSLQPLGLNKIEAYQSNDTTKEFVFEFRGSYVEANDIEVKISVYDGKDFYGTYSNKLAFIGNKIAKANIDFGIKDDFYVLIDLYQNEALWISGIKLNFYNQQDCYIDKNNSLCSRIYKSEYSNGISKDIYNHFKINDSIFDKYLINNKLNPNNIKFSSEYNFSKGNSYLIIKEKVEGYDIIYNDGYLFSLNIEDDKYKSFSLNNEYYVNLLDFNYSENKQENSILTNGIHFPFAKELKEYNCYLLIEDFINITVKFEIFVGDSLIGECANSKYCLERRIYD